MLPFTSDKSPSQGRRGYTDSHWLHAMALDRPQHRFKVPVALKRHGMLI